MFSEQEAKQYLQERVSLDDVHAWRDGKLSQHLSNLVNEAGIATYHIEHSHSPEGACPGRQFNITVMEMDNESE
jgi:hypothetical protein